MATFYFHCDAKINRWHGSHQYGCSRMVTVHTQLYYLDPTFGEAHYCWQHADRGVAII